MTRPDSLVVQAADHVLTLLEILRRDDVIHINAAARELGVARSTAHRLVQTLVFRGYAVRAMDHSYKPGPALPVKTAAPGWAVLVARWRPVVEAVARKAGETAHLIVRDGTTAIFLDSVVSPHALTVGSRVGTRLPAERNSGGKILLANLPPEVVTSLYLPRADIDLHALFDQLTAIRQQGFALSSAESERGITAIGVQAPRSSEGPPVAITISGPSTRFDRRRALASVPALKEIVASAAES